MEFFSSTSKSLARKAVKIVQLLRVQFKKKSWEDFLLEVNNKHANKYVYDKNTYVDTKKPIKTTCKIHGDFEQAPSNHLSERVVKNVV